MGITSTREDIRQSRQVILEGYVIGKNWGGHTCVKPFKHTYQTIKPPYSETVYPSFTQWQNLKQHIKALCENDGDFDGTALLLECQLTVKLYSHNRRNTYITKTYSRMLRREEVKELCNLFVSEEHSFIYYDMIYGEESM